MITGTALTAVAAAAARAVESSRADRLVDDPFALAFVHAAPTAPPFPTRWPADDAVLTRRETLLLLGANYVGLRTRFLDDALAGARQVVLLGAGLDTRAFRLTWPPDAHVYELDQPDLLAFKDSVLTDTARCARTTVPADLSADWRTPLSATAFDPSAPTAWLAEGLLQYLTPAAETALLDTVDALSAPGSTLTLERSLSLSAPPPNAGIGVPVDRLLPTGTRPDLPAWLTDHHWTATHPSARDVAARYGRPLVHPRLHDAPTAPSPAGFTVAVKG
ncbi:SAM-dependent methyltransferase [Actinosynnema sp. NPDC020468]|uniref:SAM-dependent methyltransferase n=1 Tax=Actinosynnema sp. NPDC020468 TaxID=3154488 RepID=UPI0033DBFED6